MAAGRRQRAAARGAWFSAAMTAITARLPFGLARVVSPRLLGFAVLSSVTFGIDLVLLTALRSGARLPLPAGISLAYAASSGLGYVLNRVLNFRSHAAVGPQVARYAAVIAVNYLAIILGVTDGLAALGADYRLARLVAAGGESVYMYLAMRWVIFRDPAPAAGPSRDRPAGGGGYRAGSAAGPGHGSAASSARDQSR
jgi:putative flippase GtrA